MFCENCGNKMDVKQDTCPYCGNYLKKEVNMILKMLKYMKILFL